MSVHSRPSMKYQDGMELRDRKMKKDCTQPLRIGNIRALNYIPLFSAGNQFSFHLSIQAYYNSCIMQ